MDKILPINLEPLIHCYTQHGYFHAIVSSSDKVTKNENDIVADIIVEKFELYKWIAESDELTYTLSPDNHLHFYANKWNQGMNLAFYRTCEKNDTQKITIFKQLYSNAWSNISIFLTAKDTNNITHLNSYDIVVGNFAKDGVFYSNQKGYHNRIHFGLQTPLSIELSIREKKIFMNYRNDFFLSEEIFVGEINGDYTDYYIGFSVNLGNSIYYEWCFSNYIQLFSRPIEIIPIDFIVNWHKDWCVHTANHLIDYNRINQRELSIMNLSLLEFVKLQIDLGQYVEIELNDNLKWNKSDEEYGAYFHQNLIYGYSDEKECFFVLFYEKGNVAQTCISFSDFESERNNMESRNIYMLKYNPCYEEFSLSVERLLQIYKEYQMCNNISYFDSFYNGYSIGANCYRQYCDYELLEKSSWDVRFTHLLYERSKCNMLRIEYLYFTGILRETEYLEMADILKTESKNLLLARNTIIKGKMSGNISILILQKYLQQAYENDQELTKRMITYLSLKLLEH